MLHNKGYFLRQILLITTDILCKFILMIDFSKLWIILLREGGNSIRNCLKFISEEKYKKYGPSFWPFKVIIKVGRDNCSASQNWWMLWHKWGMIIFFFLIYIGEYRLLSYCFYLLMVIFVVLVLIQGL